MDWDRVIRWPTPWLGALAALMLAWVCIAEKTQVSSPSTPPSSEWVYLHGCTWWADRRNDGDSFSVRHEGSKHVFRVYFADCPESSVSRLTEKRVVEQARDFGGLTVEATLAGGVAASAFTEGLLAQRPFTVITKWQRVYESRRYYAIILPPDGGTDLATRLLEQGHARLHTQGVDLPDGTSVHAITPKLQKLEKTARRTGLGVWKKPHD